MRATRPSIRPIRAVSCDGLALQEVQYDHGVTMGRHAHPELSLTLILAGSLVESVGARATDVAAFAIGVKPFGVEHANQFAASGTRILCLKISRPWWERLDQRVPLLDRWHWVGAGPAVPTFLNVLAYLRHRAAQAPAWLETATCELLAVLDADARLRCAGDPPAWLARARARLLEDVRAGVQTTAIAREAGVHPVSLARAFRHYYGESMSQCIRRARLQRAARLLGDRTIPLVDVALEAGLADQSHLTRLCREEAGVTPGTLRHLDVRV